MPLGEHLAELRRRIYVSMGALAVGTVIGWIKYPDIYRQLTEPFLSYKRAHPESAISINFAQATSALSQQISLSAWMGLIIASPIWMWQIWAFVLPGLTRREKRVSMGFFAAVVPLFLLGCAFGFALLPKSLAILYSFTPNDPTSSNIQDVSAYFKFVTRFIFVFGATWLLPVVLVAVTTLGLVRGRVWLNHWRPAILVLFIMAAVVTPTQDPYTMFVMAAPLVVLYFGAVVICLLIDRRRVDKRPDWLDLPDDVASPL